ncbi:EscU/YscU/HrcU family type III secretion system export apparatus switch protein [Herbaspirillum frisingense]|uniref:EscU/YscU/HrcU family type III secretion system export apparatus switch protein n=1 Tax=Herbaspirillum frisingense TaxID=92645 RepID=UPI0016020E69|nr:EscU/YscU/HrcU family type III secretion system export apparatus switch protein [Herbaspirillum frisingense]QNB08846.1 EscU/YscU/HrcU family type III secretion system export apparatus switch protein [Herbaspirillum frisingense]
MAEQDMDRNQAATPHRLREARKRGQVAKSPDFNSVVVFVVMLAFLSWHGWSSMRDQFRFDQAILNLAGRMDISPAALWQLLLHGLKHCMALLAPFFATLLITAIVANLVQVGPVFSGEPLGPNWDKLNPATGFKRLFSVRTLFDAARACLKLVLLVWVVYHALKGMLPQFASLGGYSATGYLHALLDDIASLGMKIALMLALIAAVDWIYTRREFAKQMRMSHRDIRDEAKHREGDPRIRARLRELRREMLQRSLAASKVRQADVLITNPTHLAVALRYRHGEMTSPQVVAKGAGVQAAAMRRAAARHNVPVVRNQTLARKLYKELDFDHYVPQHLYAEVARIIVWVFAMRKANEAARRATAANGGVA